MTPIVRRSCTLRAALPRPADRVKAPSRPAGTPLLVTHHRRFDITPSYALPPLRRTPSAGLGRRPPQRGAGRLAVGLSPLWQSTGRRDSQQRTAEGGRVAVIDQTDNHAGDRREYGGRGGGPAKPLSLAVNTRSITQTGESLTGLRQCAADIGRFAAGSLQRPDVARVDGKGHSTDVQRRGGPGRHVGLREYQDAP